MIPPRPLLNRAVKEGWLMTLKLLLLAGMNPYIVDTYRNESAYRLAIENTQTYALEIIIKFSKHSS